MTPTVDFDSPYYPYRKVIATNTLYGLEDVPYKILRYLLDLPDAYGYQPKDDNTRARVRLMKYIYWDTADPLSQPLPTTEQKLSLLFDPDHPDINTDELIEKHPKGYRLYWQRMYGMVQLDAQTILKCYMGRMFETKKFVTTVGLQFEVLSNVNLQTNTRTDAYQRAFAVEQCLHEALDGVNIDGIGTISFARADHLYNGSEISFDETVSVGRAIHFSLDWGEGGGDDIKDY